MLLPNLLFLDETIISVVLVQLPLSCFGSFFFQFHYENSIKKKIKMKKTMN